MREEKDPGVSNRDINGLMDRGIYTAKARSWSNILLCAALGGQDMVAIFVLRERGRLPVIGKVNNRLTPWLPGKPAEEHAPHCSL